MFTMRMLRSAAACRRRFYLEHELGLQLAARERPRLRSTLNALLAKRDQLIASGATRMEIWPVLLGEIYGWRDLWARAPFPVDTVELDGVVNEAREVLEHYHSSHDDGEARYDGLKIHKSRRRFGQVSQKLLASQIPIPHSPCGGLGCPGCRGRGWAKRMSDEFCAVVPAVVESPHGAWVLYRVFTSDASPERVAVDLRRRVDLPGLVWLASDLLGLPVRGILADVVRTKAPADPVTTKCRSCRGSGLVTVGREGGEKIEGHCRRCGGTGVGGFSRAPVDTTLSRARRVVSAYPQVDERDRCELLDRVRARGETFAYRRFIAVEQERVRDWISDTYATVREVVFARATGRWPRSPGSCVGRTPCPYREACSTPAKSSSVTFVESSEDYPGEHILPPSYGRS